MPSNAATAMIGEFVQNLQKHNIKRAAEARADRCERYMARVDEHMKEMDREAKLTFLRAELEKWHTRYENFTTEVFSGRPLTTDATAWDYSITIATVAARIGRLERETEKASVA